ncbi:tyrosine-protein kinase receptor [Holotrichia oblita]|uniref:Tyrosine-protein kinase receptor n=1 Tax=Holotrichia oblita TaxID=644536 RepID=A0ACB9TVZ0_HOLOL|nr:tyrosine-protein kinase receptor [Holotrichia oblita]
MENGAIKDEDITASSSFDSGNVGPQHGRIRTENNGGAWCPQKQATTEPEEWLQIDLKTVHVITATGTQGRFGNGQGVEYAEAYVLEYWRPRIGKWTRYHNSKGEEVLKGNMNTYLEFKQELDPPIWASKFRFYPYSYHKRTVCLRVELYGCKWTDGIVSYTMPQGDKRGPNWEFYDSAYDGPWDGHELKHGLGQLIDGKYGRDDFRDVYGGQAWVGWKNDTRTNKPLEIKFEFDKVREFSATHIFCNNLFTKDVQIFSSAKLLFSIGGKRFNRGEPISFEYMEDRIFENARNITIKLHHRIGKFVKIQLYFAARWMLISEINFDSIVAHGNFTPEPEPTTISPVKAQDKNQNEHKIEIPLHNNKFNDYLAVIVIGLIAIILLLGVVIFLTINRFRNRKFLRSPNSSNIGFPDNTLPHLQTDSVFNTTEKGSGIEAYGVTDIDECRRSHGSLKSSLRSTLPLPHPGLDHLQESNEYQEPYQALKYAPYYSYSSVVMEMQDILMNSNKKFAATQSDAYDYAIPEAGTLPLLASEKATLPLTRSRGSSITSKSARYSSPRNSHSSTPTQQEALTALRKRLEDSTLPEFPRHRLRMLSKLSEGAFGTVYIAEADGIAEYSSALTLGTRLVAIKFLGENASDKERKDFYRDVRILAALEDHNIARVLGICTKDEPLCVVMEYLDHGDLCQFLKSHVSENTSTILYGVKTLSFNCLLYMGAQIASGMRYLESLNFVHRDLATRNCLVGKAYHIKICDFGTYNELYASDYYKVDGITPLPIRWMAWESVYQGKYTTKSDVWAFAVTLWEILTLCRRIPYDGLGDPNIMENLAHMHCDDGQFMFLPRPVSNKDINDLMLECWRRKDLERPSFTEIHLFLQRKNLGYAPT